MKKFFKKYFGPTKFKRLFDIIFSFLALIILSPVFLVICVINFFTPDCKVFFSHERRGRKGQPFKIYKFQTMKNYTPNVATGELEHPEKYITKIGRILRKTSLDELPQLWNVLKGDMSFIGYRPERQFYINQIKYYNPRYDYLFQIRPGVTSYATLYNGYTDTMDKMLTRLDLDLYYLRNHTVWFDIKVLGLTFLSIVTGKKF